MENNRAVREQKYIGICEKLGIRPEIHFVEITSRGTITFTCGKPDEIRYLLSQCKKAGLTPARSLVKAASR